jgi:hypothetical protein
MTYETLLKEAESEHLIVKEKPLHAHAGRIKGDRIAIRKDLVTTEKACVLAEELGHHYTTSGNILEQSDTGNRKQELRARLWAYNRQIGLMGIVRAYQRRCNGLSEMAEYLDVTEQFLADALEQYHRKYGRSVTVDNYVILFEPYLAVMETRELFL